MPQGIEQRATDEALDLPLREEGVFRKALADAARVVTTLPLKSLTGRRIRDWTALVFHDFMVRRDRQCL